MNSFLQYFDLDMFVQQTRFLTPSEVLNIAKDDSHFEKILSDADFWTKRFLISKNSAGEFSKKDSHGCSWINILGNIANTRVPQVDAATKALWYEILAIKPNSNDAIYDSIVLIKAAQTCPSDSLELDDLIKKITRLEKASKNLNFILEKLKQIKKLQNDKKGFQSVLALVTHPFDRLVVAINYPHACIGLNEFEDLMSTKSLLEMFTLAIQKDRKDVAAMILPLLNLCSDDVISFVNNLIKQNRDDVLKYLFEKRYTLPSNLKTLFCTSPQTLANEIMYWWRDPKNDEKIIIYIELIKRLHGSSYGSDGYNAFELLRERLFKKEKSYYGHRRFDYKWEYIFRETAEKFFEHKRGALVHALFESRILDRDQKYTLQLGNTRLSNLRRHHLAAIADAPDSIDKTNNFADIFVKTKKFSMLRACVVCLCCCCCCGYDGNYPYRRFHTATPLQLALIFSSPNVTQKILNENGSTPLIDTNNRGHNALDIANEMLKDKQHEKIRESYKQTAMIFYQDRFLKKNKAYITERSHDQGTAIVEKDGVTRHYKYYLSFFGIKKIGLGCSFEAKKVANDEVASYIKAGGKGELSKAAKQGRLGKILREFETVRKKINR